MCSALPRVPTDFLPHFQNLGSGLQASDAPALHSGMLPPSICRLTLLPAACVMVQLCMQVHEEFIRGTLQDLADRLDGQSLKVRHLS